MKTKIALPLFCALGFLMIFATIGSAQMPLHPDDMVIQLDSSYLHYNMNQQTIPQYTVRGSIISFLFSGSFTVGFEPTKQWDVSARINGNTVQSGDVVGISAGQTFPIEVTITPHGEGADTEIFMMFIAAGGKGLAVSEIMLYTTGTKAAVSTDLPTVNLTLAPNPAGNYISVRGLAGAAAEYEYEIYSMTGAEIHHGILPADARIDVHELASGAYRLLLFDGKRTLSNSAFTILH